MDDLVLALKLKGKEKTTEEKSEVMNPSTASIVYMVAVTASSGGEVVLMDEVDEAAEWEDGDFTEVDEEGDFEEYESDDDPMEDVDDSVVDMTDGDGVDIEETDGETLVYTVADYHEAAVAAYTEEEGEVVEDDLPEEDVTIDDTLDDGDAETIPDIGELDEDELPDEDATTDEISDDDYTLTDDNSDDESDEIEGAEVSDGYTVAECIGSVKAGDRVAVAVQNGKLTVLGVIGSGDEEEALRQQAEEAADEASQAAANAQTKADQAEAIAGGAAQDATEAKEQAEAAKTAATNAENAAKQAQTEAQEAAQKALDAETKADTVEKNMADVNAEVATIKEDAVKLRADMETEIQTVKTTMSQSYATKDEVSTTETILRSEFTESIAGIQTTFAQDYAKKTELEDAVVDAKAELQSQITVNANAITTAVKSIEDVKVDITNQDGKIAAAQQAATDAQNIANQAATDAGEAQTVADEAKAQATAANTAATNAQTEANQAKTKADEAQALADAAKTDLAKAESKLAEVEGNAAANAEDIAQAQKAVEDAKAAVEDAQAAADKAKADAAAAQSTADQAKTDASNASTAASNAQAKADEAKTAADNAQQAADEAKEDLEALEGRVTTAETTIEQHSEAIALRATKEELSALEKRVSAAELKITADAIISTVSGTYVSKSDASETYSTKTELTQTASGLETKITTAQNNAAKTATNFMSYDDTNGLLVGNKSSGSWSGSRAQILPSAFNVLDSSGTQLASFGTTARIGKLTGNNIYIDSDSVDIRKGTTVLSSFTEDGIYFGHSNIAGILGVARLYNQASSDWNQLVIESDHSLQLSANNIYLNTYFDNGNNEMASVATIMETSVPWSDQPDIVLAKYSVDCTSQITSNETHYIRMEMSDGWFGLSAENTATDKISEIIISCYGGDEGVSIDAPVIYLSATDRIYPNCNICFPNGKGIQGYLSDGTTMGSIAYISTSNNLVIGSDSDFADHAIYIGLGNLELYLRTASCGAVLTPSVSTSSIDGYFEPTVDAMVSLGTSSKRWYRLHQSHASVSLSDEREKENIIPLGASPVMTLSLEEESTPYDIHSELFDRLIPVQYNFIENDARICYGLIAQQVVSAMEELGINENELDLVHHDSWIDEETGEAKDSFGLAYENIIALLIHEVQKLKKQIS